MSERNRIVIKPYPIGACGGEAEVTLEKRNYFPGRGEPIVTDQVFAVARRVEHSQTTGTAERMFFRHVIIKKLDDYFVRTGQYDYSHIARPLGFEAGETKPQAYFYEWSFGREVFPNASYGEDGNRVLVQLDEWSAFVAAFGEAGVPVHQDTTDADNAYVSKNIIHQAYQPHADALNCFWKRIDFGPQSLTINHDTLEQYLDRRADDLIAVLRIERYELVRHALAFLKPFSVMDERDAGKLDILTRDYLVSSSRHHRTKFSIH